MNKMLLTAALAGVITAGATFAARADDMMEGTGKCYGIAKAGKNSCANAFGTHSCKGQAKVDGDGGDFVMATSADCTKEGGSAEPKK